MVPQQARPQQIQTISHGQILHNSQILTTSPFIQRTTTTPNRTNKGLVFLDTSHQWDSSKLKYDRFEILGHNINLEDTCQCRAVLSISDREFSMFFLMKKLELLVKTGNLKAALTWYEKLYYDQKFQNYRSYQFRTISTVNVRYLKKPDQRNCF